MSKEYTESFCRSRLERMGCKFGGMNTFTVSKGRLGIASLGMVDFLQNNCKMTVKYV